VQQQDGEGGRN